MTWDWVELGREVVSALEGCSVALTLETVRRWGIQGRACRDGSTKLWEKSTFRDREMKRRQQGN